MTRTLAALFSLLVMTAQAQSGGDLIPAPQTFGEVEAEAVEQAEAMIREKLANVDWSQLRLTPTRPNDFSVEIPGL